ncbi:MAG: hypothetical protein FD167_1588, partial [bacterium]
MAEDKMPFIGKLIILIVIVGCLAGGYYFLAGKSSNSSSTPNDTPNSTSTSSNQWKGNAVEIGIAYGTEKKTWLEWAVQEFAKTPDGEKIKINLIPSGSQEGAQALVAGDKKIHVWAPASSLYKDTFVLDWQTKYNNNPILKEDS